MSEPTVQPIAPPQIYQARTVLKQADILAWPAGSGIQVVPAPGADKVALATTVMFHGYFPDVYSGMADYDSIVVQFQELGQTEIGRLFNGETGADFLTRFLTHDNEAADPDVISYIQVPSSAYDSNWGSNITSMNASPLLNMKNLPLLAIMDCDGLAGGGADNVLTINVLYYVYDLSLGLFV